MTKKTSTAAVDSCVASKEASSIASTLYNSMVGDKLTGKAKIVIAEFVRKDDERQTEIAVLNASIANVNAEIAELTKKLSKAEKVSNQAALTRNITIAKADITVSQAEITELHTLRSAANDKKNAFIAKFDKDPYAALADTNLVMGFVARKISKAA